LLANNTEKQETGKAKQRQKEEEQEGEHENNKGVVESSNVSSNKDHPVPSVSLNHSQPEATLIISSSKVKGLYCQFTD
jgi:hypothetical protein